MDLANRTVIDLTHPISTRMPVSIGFPRVLVSRYLDREAGDVATVEVVQLSLHTGTHVDAPMHFIDGGLAIDGLDPLALCGTAAVVDITPTEEWRAVERRDIDAWQMRAGTAIGEGDIVLLRTGHARYWRDLPAGSAYLTQPWPFLGESLVDLLLERRIRALGVECPDPDKVDQRDLSASSFMGHHRLLGAGIPIIENLANLAAIPVPRVDFLAFGLPFVGASGSPIRALALLPM